MVPPGEVAPGPRRVLSDRVVLGIFLLGALLRILPATRPLAFIDDVAIPDDAYLSLTIARNLARGLGPWYGLAPTNGFQPLYVFLATPFFAWFPHDYTTPVKGALWLLIACDSLALIVLTRLASRLTAHAAVPRLVALSWAINPYAILTSLNALETSLSFLLALLAFDFLGARLAGPAHAELTAREGAALGGLIGLASLARIDNLLLIPALGLPIAFGRAGLASRVRTLLAMAAGVLAVQAPWLVWSWHWTGLLFPVSGRAVRYQCLSNVGHAPTWANFYGPLALKAARIVIAKHPVYLALIGLLAAGLLFLRGGAAPSRGRSRRLAPPLLFGGALLLAYCGVIFGPWYFARYFFPLTLPLALGMAALMDRWLERLPGPASRRWLIAGTTLLVIAGNVLQPAFRRLYFLETARPWGYLRIGVWAREHFPPGTTIGGSQTGALGYFADSLTVVNLDGVVNQAAFEALRRKRAIDYVRSTGIRYLVWQDDIEFIARESRDFRPGDLDLVETVPDFRTLNQDWHVYRVRYPGSAP